MQPEIQTDSFVELAGTGDPLEEKRVREDLATLENSRMPSPESSPRERPTTELSE